MRSSVASANSLCDIIDNAERVARHLQGLRRTQFARNELARDAVERCIERACEAAVRLGARAEVLMPDQPWRDIRSMGNRLRHAYDRVEVAVVWQVAKVELPALAADARRALALLAAPDAPTRCLRAGRPPNKSGF